MATVAFLNAHLQLAAGRHSPLFGLTDFVHVSESDDSNDDPEGDGDRPDLHTAPQPQSVCYPTNPICGDSSLVCGVIGVVRGALGRRC